jgi:ketosteroid isomerase-like protein
MSNELNTVTRVVERMLDHAAHGRWDALPDVVDEHFEIVEPDSLPYGGTHHGVEGYIALMQEIGSLFELAFEPQGVHALDDRTVVLRMNVTFTARSTARSVTQRVVELLDVQRGRVRRSEVFLADTAALLATLGRVA